MMYASTYLRPAAPTLVDAAKFTACPRFLAALMPAGIHLDTSQHSIPNVDLNKSSLATPSAGCQECSRETFFEFPEDSVRSRSHLQLEAKDTYRRSSKMRLEGETDSSEFLIRTFLSRLRTRADELAYEDLASLHLSQANNHAYNFRLSEAHDEVKKWCPSSESPNERQQDLLWDQLFCVGRILRGEGRFEEAKIFFETCLRYFGLSRSRRFLAKSAIADLYCELAYLQPEMGTKYLSLAQEIVKPEIELVRQSSSQHLKGYWRLLLSLTEVKIRLCHYCEAALLLRELLDIYHSLGEPDIVDCLGHV